MLEEAPAERTNLRNLQVQLGPLCLRHPFLNASGTMDILELAGCFGEEILSDPPVSAYVPKTITLAPRAGNSPPRILETPAGLINSIGLGGEGFCAFASNSLPKLLTLPCPLIVSIAGFSPCEYAELARRLRQALDEQAGQRWQEKVGLELNISCPNVSSGCQSIGTDPAETEGTVAAVRAHWPGLLIAKLTPNVTDIATVAAAAESGGADAIAAVNTYKGLVIDRETLHPFLGNVSGGLSGPAIKPLALWAVFEIFARVQIPVIGMGGVASVQDALDFLACGATAVAVGSATFRNPWLAKELATGLAGELQRRSLALHTVIGMAH